MLRNYFKISLRNLWRRKTHSLINVVGLAIGLASAIVIFLIVRYELSFDQFHTQADRIYRVVSDTYGPNGEEGGNTGVPHPLPDALRQDFADDIMTVVPVERYQSHQRIEVNDKTIFADGAMAYTESAYLQIFDVLLREGNPRTALALPNTALISASLSHALFGRSQDIQGEIIKLDDTHELKVTGVLAEPLGPSDFAFDLLISFTTIARNRPVDTQWDYLNSAFQAFVLLCPETSPEALQSQLRRYLDQYHTNEEDSKPGTSLYLQPLSAIHHEGKYAGFPYRKATSFQLGGLSLLAVLLIGLACINFINLTTAVSARRTKEIGVRKVVGSSRRQIMFYFLGEALLVTLLATVLALGLAELGLLRLQRWYEYLQEIHLSLDASAVAFLLLLVLGTTLLAGGYLALVLSRFQPVSMLKAHPTASPQRHRSLRSGLVVFQFFVTQLFILSVLTVGQQLQYLMEAPLGFNQEAVLTVSFPDGNPQRQKYIKQALQGHTGVQSLSRSMFTAISQSMSATTIGYDGTDPEESELSTWYQFADADYFDTHRMTLLAGDVYLPSDSGSGFVANEAFLHEVGATSPEEIIGKYIRLNDLELPVVGVVADYHTNTFDQKIPPLLITNYSPRYQHLSLKVNMAQSAAVIERLAHVWQESYAEFPLEYRFLDQAIARFYRSHQRLLALIQLFSGIAILIGCLGLYGLVMFMAEQRTKEIGIRKVLGASVQQLLTLFSGQFIKLVIVAFCLAAPLAYFLITAWLEGFAYRIQINGWMFVGCLLLSLLLVMLTVGYRSLRAAMTNPVNALRDE